MLCPKCGFEGNPNLEETGPHTKASCRKCGTYIKMVGKEELDKIINQKPKENILTIKTDVCPKDVWFVLKQVNNAIVDGRKEGNGTLTMHNGEQYKFSFTYE